MDIGGIKVVINPFLPPDTFMLICNPRKNETLAEYMERQGWVVVRNVGKPAEKDSTGSTVSREGENDGKGF